MNLPVVPARLLLVVETAEPFGLEVSGDAEGVGAMRLRNSVLDACMLRQIAVGIAHFQFRMRRLQSIEHLPSHDAHEGFGSERRAALDAERDLAAVKRLVARLAERDQIARRIAAGSSAFQMMNVEHRILRPAAAVPADMPVSEEHVFADIPKAELFALLIAFSGNIGIF